MILVFILYILNFVISLVVFFCFVFYFFFFFLCLCFLFFFFFFSSRRRHTRWNCDWSSDVCSSDLVVEAFAQQGARLVQPRGVDEDELRGLGADDAPDRVTGGLRLRRGDGDLEIGRASCRERV